MHVVKMLALKIRTLPQKQLVFLCEVNYARIEYLCRLKFLLKGRDDFNAGKLHMKLQNNSLFRKSGVT